MRFLKGNRVDPKPRATAWRRAMASLRTRWSAPDDWFDIFDDE